MHKSDKKSKPKKKLVRKEMTDSERARLEELFEKMRREAKERSLSFIARKKAPELAGFAISAGALANADSAGEGPEGMFYIGRSACYPLDSFIAYLKKRAGL